MYVSCSRYVITRKCGCEDGDKYSSEAFDARSCNVMNTLQAK